MTSYPVQLRIGSEYAEPASFADAVQAIRGDHSKGYHNGTYCYAVAVYPERIEEEGHGGKIIVREAGEPLFAFRVTINPRDTRYRSLQPAQVNWPSIGASNPEDVILFTSLLTLASQVAAAANLGGCPDCDAE